MTPRPHARTRRAALVMLIAGAFLFPMPGCNPGAMLFFLQPYDPVVPKTGPSLERKKVVVLTHVSGGTGADYNDLPRELTREVVAKLRKEVPKITVVNPEQVAEWIEAHPAWTDPTEAAKAFEADAAIMLDVSNFQTEDPKSVGLMEGKSNIHIQVWELDYPKDSNGKPKKNQAKEGNMLYSEQADTTFPVRGPIPTGNGISASSFRIKFLKQVALEISWHFADHAPGDDIQDTKFNPNDTN